jgi:thymidylate synthase
MELGADVVGRGGKTKELLHRVTTLEKPAERFLFLPGRLNDVFAQIAESLWVIAGRNDIDWLGGYLPRAGDASDDGRTWRAGYGPRLRRWHGAVDQIGEVRRLLRNEASTRRAVMSLFDPGSDFIESKDIPCNNWLSWIIRAGKLHLNVAVRSNDAMWGFSGANAFEWSVLHEMMALWTGTEVGTVTYLATSFHLYEHHYARAKAIAAGFHGITPYDFAIPRLSFTVPWDRLDEFLRSWFELEEQIRNDPESPVPNGVALEDPFLAPSLHIIRLKWGNAAWDDGRLAAELSQLPESDALAAAYEYFGRRRPAILENIPHAGIAAFFDACRRRTAGASPHFAEAVKRLHARKDRAYGAAWKKRGERISVLPNVARKVDRLEVFVDSGEILTGETVLDTAVDLYVYVTKYRLFLEEDAEYSGILPADAPKPFSDHDANFDHLVDGSDFHPQKGDTRKIIKRIVQLFADLWPRIEAGACLTERRRLAGEFGEAALSLLAALIHRNPQLAERFAIAEIAGLANER